MRRPCERFGCERCRQSVWCSENSPARSGACTAGLSSTAPTIAWPARLTLPATTPARCGRWPPWWLSGKNSMQPFSAVASVSDEPRRGVDQDVRADQIFDGIEDRRMARERMHPGEQHVRARPIARVGLLGGERSADRLLESLESA